MSADLTTPAVTSLGVIDEIDLLGLKVTVLKAAMELDVCSTIAHGHTTLEAITEALECHSRGMQVLLDAMCPIGLLTKRDGAYTLTPLATAFLVKGSPTYCGDIYLAWFQARERFADCVRTGKPALDLTTPEAEQLWVSYSAPHILLWPQLAGAMRMRWESAGITAESSPAAKVLDVACGSGVKSFVLAQADPTAQITANDSAKVLAISRAVASAMGIAGQVRYLPGSALDTEFGREQFDIVLMGNILHYFNAEQMHALLTKTHQALRPGGILVIDDGVLDEQPSLAEDVALAAVEVALAAVEMANSAPYAAFHTLTEYRTALEAASFSDVTLHGARPITARKPA